MWLSNLNKAPEPILEVVYSNYFWKGQVLVEFRFPPYQKGDCEDKPVWQRSWDYLHSAINDYTEASKRNLGKVGTEQNSLSLTKFQGWVFYDWHPLDRHFSDRQVHIDQHPFR